jgi:hypothetical protein
MVEQKIEEISISVCTVQQTNIKPQKICIFLFFVILSGVRLSPLGTAATVWPIVATPDDR